jgi:two-component system response regulator YesN
MHSVLIVDDEPWVAYGMKALIDWESLGFAVIGEAHNGIQALQSIAEKKPDVVISDIRMPGLNGIELLENIAHQGLPTKVILVSGYAEFEYAQQAIRLGAFDYLLKQVDKQKLTDTLLRLRTVLFEKQQPFRELDLMLEDLFDLFEPESNIKIANFLTHKGMEAEYPHFRFVSCIYPYATGSDTGKDPAAAAPEGIQRIRFRTGQNKMTYLINYDEQGHPLALLDFISAHLEGAQNIGISSIGLYSSLVGKLYQESDIALSSSCFLPDQRIAEYKATDQAATLTKAILQIEWAIKEQKREQLEHGLDELCEECKSRRMTIDQVSRLYNQIVSLVYKYYNGSDAAHEVEYMSYSQIARSYGSMEQLFGRIKAVFDRPPGEEQPISNETVRKLIEYIDSSFTEDISLSTLSRQFNVSIGYLSALIKKETGTTYSDYVVAKRLNMAKELLGNAQLSIQEIVERVGYKDYFHFNKLFKKHFGITPSKYRKI